MVLADLCFQGVGMPKDVDQGFNWLDMAARVAKKPEAFAVWGTKLMEGLICKRDFVKAKEVFEFGAAGCTSHEPQLRCVCLN